MATSSSSASSSTALALSLVAGAALASTATLFALRTRGSFYPHMAVDTSNGSDANQETREKKWSAEELIAHRRSIMPPYDPERVVPREIIEKMLEGANWAPTHARTEPWRFVVFAGEESRRQLGEFEGALYKKMIPEGKFLQSKFDKKVKSKMQSSYVIAICMKRQASEQLSELDELCAVACAVQNMHLIATAHGVGAYWSSGGPIFSDEMKEYLKLGAKDKCIGLFYVGYPKAGASHPVGARKPIADKVTWLNN